jgi:hypothetical protein
MPMLAVKSGSEFVALGTGGTEVRTPSSRADDRAWIAMVAGGYLAAEFPPEYSEREETEQPLLSFIDLPSGEVRWQREISARAFDIYFESPLISDEFYVYQADEALHSVRLEDGIENFVTPVAARRHRAGLSGSRLAYQDETGSKQVFLADLDQGTQVPMLSASIEPSDLQLGLNRLTFFNDNRTLGGQFNTVYAVWSLPLLDGVALRGDLAQVNRKEPSADLRNRLIAASDPIADTALMADLVRAGTTELLSLLEHVDASSGPQLDAILAAAFHSSGSSVEHSGPMAGAAQAVIDKLSKKLDETYVPRLITWANDPSLAAMRPQLAGMLARAGGPAAKAHLDGLYTLPPQEFNPPEPPLRGCSGKEYTVYPPMSRNAAADNLVSTTYRDFAEITVGGVEYELFTYDMLGSPRDIYLGLTKSGNDGGYDEVLYTGLSDLFFRIGSGYSSGEEIHRRGPIKLKVKGDTVTISHHVPVYKTKKYDEGTTYQDWVDTKYVADKLSLKSLRRDLDADGLTDILEDVLRTDPKNSDSDTDGVPDKHDRLPNVDPSRWGQRERALARALQFHNLGKETSDEDECGNLPPFKVRFFAIGSDIPVAIPVGSSYCVHQPLQSDGAWTVGPVVSAGWDDNVAGWQHAWGNSEPAFGPEVKAFVHLGSGNMGYRLEMTEIDGEFYPLREGVTSIAD